MDTIELVADKTEIGVFKIFVKHFYLSNLAERLTRHIECFPARFVRKFGVWMFSKTLSQQWWAG